MLRIRRIGPRLGPPDQFLAGIAGGSPGPHPPAVPGGEAMTPGLPTAHGCRRSPVASASAPAWSGGFRAMATAAGSSAAARLQAAGAKAWPSRARVTCCRRRRLTGAPRVRAAGPGNRSRPFFSPHPPLRHMGPIRVNPHSRNREFWRLAHLLVRRVRGSAFPEGVCLETRGCSRPLQADLQTGHVGQVTRVCDQVVLHPVPRPRSSSPFGECVTRPRQLTAFDRSAVPGRPLWTANRGLSPLRSAQRPGRCRSAFLGDGKPVLRRCPVGSDLYQILAEVEKLELTCAALPYRPAVRAGQP